MPIHTYARRKYIRRRKRRRWIAFLLVLLLILLLGIFFGWIYQQKTRLSGSNILLQASDLFEQSAQKAPALSFLEAHKPPPAESKESDESDVLPTYQPGTPLPESEPVADDYFSDAVFIGNSRTQGFILYSGLANTNSYTDRGLSVTSALEKEIASENGRQMTIPQALALHNYQKVYLMFGINELGWAYSDIFITRYGELIDAIRAACPQAMIYVQSILPVTKEKSDGDQIYNMEKINSFNLLIQQMTAEKQAIYLNVAEAVADEAGYLPEEASADGIHLKKAYCERWLNYLKTHTADQFQFYFTTDPTVSEER